MFGNGFKPVKATGTRWINHRIRAIGRVLNKFGLYTRHLNDLISRVKNSKTKATVQGKLNNLLDGQVILRSAFLKDLMTSAKYLVLSPKKKTRISSKLLNQSRKQKRIKTWYGFNFLTKVEK